MFDVYCTNCEKQQLLSPGQVRSLINDDQGIAVIYECYCGELGAMRTGAAYEAKRQHAVAG